MHEIFKHLFSYIFQQVTKFFIQIVYDETEIIKRILKASAVVRKKSDNSKQTGWTFKWSVMNENIGTTRKILVKNVKTMVNGLIPLTVEAYKDTQKVIYKVLLFTRESEIIDY